MRCATQYYKDGSIILAWIGGTIGGQDGKVSIISYSRGQ
jgi:hypothetical protein